MFDHHCPQLSPNSTTPNMTASSCAARVKRKEGKCAKCPSGIGYVAPVKKVITEKLWRNPNEEKRVRKPKNKVSNVSSRWRPSNCGCGNKRELKKTYCEECRVKNLAVALAKTRLKFLLRQRDKLNIRIANVRELIKG